MSSDGTTTLFWGDDETSFRIGIGEFRELQERVNARRAAAGLPAVGPSTLANTIRANDAWPDDVRDVLRIGLVGAGMTPAEAHRKLVQYFDRRPPAESYLVAFAALVGAFLGVPGDEIDVKKKTPTPDPTNPSPSQSSTPTVQ
jgi:Phage tail tube protein, GTA-gp10